jgi:hypothetical protein
MHIQDRDVRAPLDLFHRTYHSLLRSSGEIQIQALVEPYSQFEPSLHVSLRDAPDLSALTYTSLRLPGCIDAVRLVLLGQSHEVFARHGYGDVLGWQPVSAPGRRRKMFFDGRETLAVLIASPSDVDDLIPMLVAFQIEWNKLHARLGDPRLRHALERLRAGESVALEEQEDLLAPLGLQPQDAARLRTVWGAAMPERLQQIAAWKKRFAVRMLGGSLMDYERATLRWWWHIEQELAALSFRDRPVYFVSSNTHSLVNLFSGFALRNTDELLQFIRQREHTLLLEEYQKIAAEQVHSSIENFFYYVQKKYQSEESSRGYFARRADEERTLGIHRVASRFYVDVDAQVIELDKLDPDRLDPRLRVEGHERLRRSDALLVNIDYPLGLAAYHILKIVARSCGELRGVYVLGKAATLNGKIGDVLIPNVVYDEHTGTTYSFAPAFSAADVEPYLAYGSALDNQKAVTSRGTFLQNEAFFDALYRDFFTDIEMEGGPYLNAIYEQTFAERYPSGAIVSFLRPPFDLGFLHYASDTPYSKGLNLGARNLSYFGMDPTYATSLAVARRVIQQEVRRLD